MSFQSHSLANAIQLRAVAKRGPLIPERHLNGGMRRLLQELQQSCEQLQLRGDAKLQVTVDKFASPALGTEFMLSTPTSALNFWVGHAGDKLSLTTLLGAPVATVQAAIASRVQALWSSGWELLLRDASKPGRPQTLLIVRCQGFCPDAVTHVDDLSVDGLFWLVDLTVMANECLRFDLGLPRPPQPVKH